MLSRSPYVFLFAALVACFSGCGKRGGLVYVLEEPQSMTLTASASSTTAKPGDTIVLRVERRTEGKWKQIPLAEVQKGQCWVYQPPAQHEPEVADNVHWAIAPENGAVLDRNFRMDHTKVATINIKGTITFTPVSKLKCEDDRAVEGTPIRIEVS